MRLGIHGSKESLNRTKPYTYTRCNCHAPNPHEYGPDEPKVIMHLRPWGRTAQVTVEERAKKKNIAIMDADAALKGIGGGDKKAEAYLREMADYIVEGWENVEAMSPVFYTDPKGRLLQPVLDFYGSFLDRLPSEDEITKFALENPDLVEFNTGDDLPCEPRFKVMMFEDVQSAVDVVRAAVGFASTTKVEEQKNAERSSDGSDAAENLLTLASA